MSRPLEFVDTHLHLEELADLDGTLEAAAEAGVTRLITMGTDLDSSRGAVSMAQRGAGIFAAIGHHGATTEEPDFGGLEELALDPRVVAVGEVGIDGPFTATSLERQAEWFDEACALARRHRLPVCVHVRDSASQVIEVLQGHPGLTGVIHYFSLDRAWAERFRDLGLHLSFAGLTTRAQQHELREVASSCPAERLVLETDSPFGTPRGRRGPNQPAYLLDTARLIAELRGISLEELSDLQLANVRLLFPNLV